MPNAYDSWHDSDDIDSDIEQEAYDRLYYNKIEETKDDILNDSILSTNSNETIEQLNTSSVNLFNSSDSVAGVQSNSDSDSDDVKYIKRISCKNKINNLCVSVSSDENDFDITDDSIMLNVMSKKSSSKIITVSSDSDFDDMNSPLIDKNSSLMINAVSGTSAVKFSEVNMPESNKIDRLFFDENPKINDNWGVTIKPPGRNRHSSRYFDSGSKSSCGICLKKGHSDGECTRSGPICILCGTEGHMSKRCDKVVCCVCFQNDHPTKNCPSSGQFLRQGCRRCGQRGHSDKICPDLWRQYKYTTIMGPPVLAKFSSQNKTTVFCANCARSGHFTEQCPRSRMNSRFLGPPPIMEIIKFEDCDIYSRAGLIYSDGESVPLDADLLPTIGDDMPSFIGNIDVSMIVKDDRVVGNGVSSDVEMIDEDAEQKNCRFGHEIIMLSPISANANTAGRPQQRTMASSSTPRLNAMNGRTPKLFDPLQPKVPTKLPGITTDLLKKLFPEETENLDKLPPALRKKLRKKLKNLIDHGYLPGDTNLTQERMEFWLQEISTGRSLNYREKKKLLGSVSAALHSISDRVSTTDVGDYSPNLVDSGRQRSPSKSLSVPESRRMRNKLSRQEKNLKNELKVSRKEKKEIRNMEKILDRSIKERLRNVSTQPAESMSNVQNKTPKPQRLRKRKRKSGQSESIQLI